MATPDALAGLRSARTMLLPSDVADFFHVHVSTIYRWIDEGRLPSIQLHRTIRIPRESLRGVLERGLIEATVRPRPRPN